jgi:cyclopropane fatty-acyl-phospholipid synthase-like methyltransferase
MIKKHYNTTDLDPFRTLAIGVAHRDQYAHLFRWTHILHEAKIGEIIVDFGCGNGNMLEVFYRNKFKCKKYIGIDIREKTIASAIEYFKDKCPYAQFYVEDLVKPTFVDFTKFKADKVISFEVAEHVGKHNIDKFLTNFQKCGHDNATYYLSTPNYDDQVGAAGNHTYDAGDGKGVHPQEFEHFELQEILEDYFDIQDKFGTFASIKDYKPLLNDWQKKMFKELSRYYDSNMLSIIMAPFFPENSRNTLWVLRNKL